MTPIEIVNENPELVENTTPHKTKFGGFVWLTGQEYKEKWDFYQDVIGIIPPENNLTPAMINNKWYWING